MTTPRHVELLRGCGALVMAEAVHSSTSNITRLIDCTGHPELCSRLLKELTGVSILNTERQIEWAVDNKYYSTTITIHIHHMTKGGGGDDEWDCEAVIFLSSLLQLDALEKIKEMWKRISNDTLPSVCLLVDVCRGESPYQQEALEWCIESGIELVEWNIDKKTENSTDENNEEEIDCDDDGGVVRISDALQAHMWPGMKMKKKGNGVILTDTSNISSEQKNKEDEFINNDSSLNGKMESKLNSDMSVEQLLSRGLMNESDPGGDETFEELFSRFAEMKVHADTLPHEERKKYAEKVVMAFWDAIGGDEEEL